MAVIPLNTDAHAAVQALLPWHAGGQLPPDEQAAVEAHLAVCAHCRAALAAERRLRDAHRALDTGGDVDRGFAAMRSRIAAERAPAAGWRGRWRRAGPAVRWLAALGAVQFGAIVVLAVVIGMREAPADFRLLGNDPTAGPAAPAPAGHVVVKFRPEATEADIRRALRDGGARIVDGPTAGDAYLLSVPAGHESRAVARLREDRSVQMAESLAGGGER